MPAMNYLLQESVGRNLRRDNEDGPEAPPVGPLQGLLAAGTLLAQSIVIVVLVYGVSRLW